MLCILITLIYFFSFLGQPYSEYNKRVTLRKSSKLKRYIFYPYVSEAALNYQKKSVDGYERKWGPHPSNFQ